MPGTPKIKNISIDSPYMRRFKLAGDTEIFEAKTPEKALRCIKKLEPQPALEQFDHPATPDTLDHIAKEDQELTCLRFMQITKRLNALKANDNWDQQFDALRQYDIDNNPPQHYTPSINGMDRNTLFGNTEKRMLCKIEISDTEDNNQKDLAPKPVRHR